MGQIRIDMKGSFSPRRNRTFSAMKHGHARCVADAIKWLSEIVLPEAIKYDHILHEEGVSPEEEFGI